MNTPAEDWEARAMSYSLDDQLGDDGEEIVEVDADLLYDAERDKQDEKAERERLKRECISGLFALGLTPRSLANQNLWLKP